MKDLERRWMMNDETINDNENEKAFGNENDNYNENLYEGG